MRCDHLLASCLLGLPLLACTGGGEGQPADNGGSVAVTQEDLVARQRMAASLLAEIPVGEGKVVFYEPSPGEVVIAKNFPIGATEPRVSNEGQLSLAEVYAAYAPNQPIPAAILAASKRMEESHTEGESKSHEVVEAPSGSEGNGSAPESSLQTREAKIALASSIDQSWFVSTKCTYSAGSSTTCFTTAYNGAYSQRTNTHTSTGGACGDTGAATLQFRVGGTLTSSIDVPYGQCWGVTHHHSHNWLGQKNKATLRYSISWAAQTVRFYAHFADSDCYII
jgi:hypothetical protein